MVPAAGADCASWISENMVERSEGRAPARGHSRRRCRRLFAAYGEEDAGTLARLAGVARAMRDVSDELVADPGHSCDASGVGVVIDVTALPLWPPASRIIAEDSDLVPRLAGVGDGYKLVFTSPTDASPAIE